MLEDIDQRTTSGPRQVLLGTETVLNDASTSDSDDLVSHDEEDSDRANENTKNTMRAVSSCRLLNDIIIWDLLTYFTDLGAGARRRPVQSNTVYSRVWLLHGIAQ